MKRLLILILLSSFLKYGTTQQYLNILPVYTDYSLWNPAAYSPSGLFNGSVNYHIDNQGSDAATKLTNIAFHYPFKFRKYAAGANLTRHNFSGLKQTSLEFGYRYNLSFSDLNSISLGLGGGFHHTTFSKDNLLALSPDDPLIQTDGSSALSYNINAGILYRHLFIDGFASTEERKQILVGFSVNQILSGNQQIYDETFGLSRRSHIYTLLRYTHPLITGIGTSFYYTNSYALNYKMNHSFSVNFNFNNVFDTDIGYNTSGKIFAGAGFAFTELYEDDRLRMKFAWTYDTKSLVQGNQLGFTISFMYTYDYDYTFHDL